MIERWSRLEIRTVRICVAALCMTLITALAAGEADANVSSVSADSDGYVPITYSCLGSGAAGIYSWLSIGGQTYGKVTVDQCLLESFGAGPQDFARVIAHEMGHSKGLLHSSYASSIMSPVMLILGR